MPTFWLLRVGKIKNQAIDLMDFFHLLPGVAIFVA